MSVTSTLFNKGMCVFLIKIYSQNENPYHCTQTPRPRMTPASGLIPTWTVCYVAIGTLTCWQERLLLGHLWAED